MKLIRCRCGDPRCPVMTLGVLGLAFVLIIVIFVVTAHAQEHDFSKDRNPAELAYSRGSDPINGCPSTTNPCWIAFMEWPVSGCPSHEYLSVNGKHLKCAPEPRLPLTTRRPYRMPLVKALRPDQEPLTTHIVARIVAP